MPTWLRQNQAEKQNTEVAFTYVLHQKRLEQGEERENKSRIRMECTAPAREQKKERTKVAFAWTSSPLHPPNRAEREMQVQAGMCRKSRVGKKTVKTDAGCDTHRKTQKNTMRNAEVNTFLHSAARRLGHFFAMKHRKNRCESKSKVQLRAKQVPKRECQHMPAKESHHPARRQTQRLPTTTTATATATTTTIDEYRLLMSTLRELIDRYPLLVTVALS